MIEISSIHALAESLGGRLITGFGVGLLLAMLAAILLRVCRDSSTRFAISFLTLLAISVFPLAACIVGGHSTAFYTMPHVSVPVRWASAIFLIWIVGSAIGLCRIAVGLWRVRKIRQRCVELDPSNASENPILRITLNEWGGSRRVSLCVSQDVTVPTAAGFFRPVILLPAWALTDLSTAELNSVLLHELGHLRRWDDWTNLAQKILKALLFFHPAVWWIDSQLALEREIACDDFVLAKTSDAKGYANCLVSVAEKSVGRRALAVAVAAVGRFRETATRLARILDQNRLGGTRVSKPALAGIALLVSAFAVGLPRMPTMVVFGDAAPVTNAANVTDLVAADHAKQVAEVIPASARTVSVRSEKHVRPMLKKAELRTRGSKPSREGHKSANQARLSRVTANQVPKPTPMLVETSWNEERVQPTFLLMTQTVVCDETGTCFVSVSAWQVSTVQQAQPTQSQTGSTSKSI